MPHPYLRILDANSNRAREGLRVLEEVARFILNDELLSAQLKQIRHALTAEISRLVPECRELVRARDVEGDVGAEAPLVARLDVVSILRANMARVGEALRVLEEFSSDGAGFQKLRFQTYEIEKQLLDRCSL
jgi:thiamine-phosphate pyrophosphorylase